MRSLRLAVAPLLFLSILAAQPAKRPLTHKDYDGWRAIAGQQLSRDGKFVAYSVFPQEGDGEVVVRDLASGKEFREPVGVRPPPAPPDPTNPEGGPPPARNIQMAFTSDLHYLVFTSFPAKADTEKAKKEKKRPEEMPKGGLGILDLTTGTAVRVASVKSFQVSEKDAGFVAYLKEADPSAQRPAGEAAPTDDEDQARQGARRGAGAGGGGPGGARTYGTELVLRRLADGTETKFADVAEYSLTKDGKTLVYAVASRKEETNGVYAVTPGSAGAPAALLSGKGKYSRLTWDRKQGEMAFLSDRDDAAAKQPAFKLYGWAHQAGQAAVLAAASTAGMQTGYAVSEHGVLRFSRDGARLFFGVAQPRPAPPDPADDAASADDRVSADLWHWKDDHIQPMQKVRATQDRNRSYRAVWSFADRRMVQLSDPTLAEVTPADAGRWAIGNDDREYRRMVEYGERFADVYLVDVTSGARKLVLKKQRGQASFSPDGRFALFFDGKDWNSISTTDFKVSNLTASLGVSFFNEEHDSPSAPPPYGNGGWTRDGKWVLLYDRYDVWQVAADGSGGKNLTAGAGRKEQVRYQVVRLAPPDDDEEPGLDPAAPLLLRAENQVNRDSGFYRTRLGATTPPEKLVMAAKNFSRPVKAKEADTLLLTASRFDEFPDLQVAALDLKQMRKVSELGAQQSKFNWGTAELVPYKNVDGVALQGILYKPENFDPRKKYPMLVYIYERLTQGLHNYIEPRPSHNINVSYYVSNGYMVLEPDIVYTIGYPGQSALKCVLPAIQAVVDRGGVDENAIGIQGHSWGGYQIAYMITQTQRFKAVAAGAPVSNMISAYDGIRWGPGLPRQFQYEQTQSRIGGSIWQYPTRFIENSPIFWADRVKTPLLMLHNDADDAVPWYQGIEYYLALRRLGKEVYMFTYNGEPHGIRRRPNQKDYTVRLQQFFDHFLKGAAAPDWMQKGIPYLDRDQEKEKIKTLVTADEK
jgi:dipeptidyl aminopeptidase/acylaminoacyl peptidase